MNTYRITIPALSLKITADNERAALEQFWHEYDCATNDPFWEAPVVERLTKPKWTNKPKQACARL